MSQMSPTKTPIVGISYEDLFYFSINFDVNIEDPICDRVLDGIAQAFGRASEGKSSLGILAVTDIPGLSEKRIRLLPMARDLALLEDKSDIIHIKSNYQTGWSHGNEVFADGRPDTAKGSFYANPFLEESTMKQESKCVEITEDTKRNHPEFFAPNVWPSTLPEFRNAMMDVSNLVIEVGRLLARPCDAYVSRECGSGYNPSTITRVLEDSKFAKARLLHYFPIDRTEMSDDENNCSDWCGWHNDHGSLTGLIPAMYLDLEGNILECPDDQTGLYIQSRDGLIHHVSLPESSIGFQIGETSQIHTGGILQATPHAVRGSRSKGVTRESFAVFMEPEFDGRMDLPKGKTVSDVQDASLVMPSSVRTLASRWTQGMTFGEFSNATFKAFY